MIHPPILPAWSGRPRHSPKICLRLAATPGRDGELGLFQWGQLRGNGLAHRSPSVSRNDALTCAPDPPSAAMTQAQTQTVFITGASSGIGKATAELFFQRGWNVVATMRTPKSERTDPRWLVTPLDVTDAASIQAARDLAIAKFGRIDALVNNAGYALVGTFESISDASIARQFETNVLGLMRVARAFLPHLRGKGKGVIVNVASMGGRLTFPFYSVYHATKWAVDGFSESLQFELAPTGVRVKLIEPGAIKTDFYERSAEFVHDESLIEYNAIVAKGMAKMNKAGEKGAKPEIVAEAIFGAATDGSKKLRYPVGADAKSLLALRRFLPDGVYRNMISGQLLK
jgi:NAD(P)-dependent dehydrogenase (short-subunit alcohol dehydrogenase family)